MAVMDIDVIPPTKADTSVPERPRKKIKTSELPLSSSTRSAIESLSHTFKKKGNYDALRKQVWETLQTSVSITSLRGRGLILINVLLFRTLKQS